MKNMSSPVGNINRIIIGLGGTGSRIVDQVYGALKKLGELKSRSLESTRFIVIDSDKQSLDNLLNIKQGSPHALKIYLTAPSSTLLKNVNPWMTDELMPAAGQGAGNRRAYGKALYWFHRAQVMQTIGNLLEKTVNITRTNKFLIIFVVGLGGGTGSGTLIDIAIDLKTFIRKNYNTDPFIIGIGILPGPREHNFNKANGYAAIKELHFLMNYGKDIGGKRLYDNPFHSFLLISRTIKGVDKDQELSEAITRFLLDIGFIPYRYREEAKGEKKDLSDLLVRIREYRQSFSTIGYYMITMPIEQIIWLVDAEQADKRIKELIEDINPKIEKLKQDFDKWNGNYQKFVKKVRAYLNKFNEWKKKGVARIRIIDKTLNESIGKLEGIYTDITKQTNTINELDKKIYELIAQRDNLLNQVSKLESEMDNVLTELMSGLRERTIYRFALTEEEIEMLKNLRDSLERHMNLSTLFKKLGRYDELLQVTVDYIAMGKIALEPLLNYEHIDITSLLERLERLVGTDVLNLLIKHNVLEYDPDEAKAYNQRWKLGYILSLIITHMSNFDEIELGKISGFKAFAERYVAMNAEPLILHSDLRRYSFVVYWWMSGLKLFSPAPGEPPRLRDIEWLRDAYNRIRRKDGWRGIITHHAFLLGEPNILAQLIGEVMEGLTPVKGREYVVRFWENYEIMDPETIFDRLAIVLGSFTVAYKQLSQMVNDIIEVIFPQIDAALKQIEAQGDITKVGGTLTTTRNRLYDISQAIIKQTNNLKMFRDEINDINTWIKKIDKIPRSIKKSLLNLADELNIAFEEFAKVYGDGKLVIKNIKPMIPTFKVYVSSIDNVALRIRLGKIVDDMEERINSLIEKLGEAEALSGEINSFLNDVTSIIKRMREEG